MNVGDVTGARWVGGEGDQTVDLVRQYAREWQPNDGDKRCQACGLPNPVWWTFNEDWNSVTGGPDGVLCPSCYHELWLRSTQNPYRADQDGERP